MQQLPYNDADYAFGQVMLTLRTAIGLTQAAVADYLGVSRRAIGAWESGNRYPTARHLKQFIALAVQQQAFPAGRDEEEIRTLWRLARQKVLLDEVWLAALLEPRHAEETNDRASHLLPAPELVASHQVRSVAGPDGINDAPPTKLEGGRSREARVDWDDAFVAPTFFGREWELRMVRECVVEERCRVVGVLGIGGIGKSALTIKLMHEVAEYFDVVIWRSLRDAPTCEALLDDCMQVLAPQPLGALPATLQERLDLLLNYMRSSRALLVLDNLETVLEEGEGAGRMRAGYEAYQQLLRRAAETDHQSCLLFTSREKPVDIVTLDGSGSLVRLVRLARLDTGACERLLAEGGVRGAASEQERLIDAYAGNPLALKIVAHTIIDLFDGEIAPFLEQGALIFGGVRELLAQQFERLSPVEQNIMFWLAIMREPVTLGELRILLVTPLSSMQLLEGVEALHNRSLVERGKTPGSFTLQSAVLEYVTAQLISQTAHAVEQSEMSRLIEYALELAQVPEYVRQTQERVILAPVLTVLHAVYRSQLMVEKRLTGLLRQLATWAVDAQGYGPANLVAFLRLLKGNLQGLDLSGLSFRSTYLQGVEMQDASLAGATIRDSAFTDAFDFIVSVDISNNGQYWAAASGLGEVRVWEAGGYTLHRVWWEPTAIVWRLALSPDGLVLAGGTSGGEIKLWDIASGALLWSGGRHVSKVNSIAFSPDGDMIASCASDGTVRLRDRQSGILRQILNHPVVVPIIAWSPDGNQLASGDLAGTIRLWRVYRPEYEGDPAPHTTPRQAPGARLEQWTCVQTFQEESRHAILGLAFSPDGLTLASTNEDGTAKLWNLTEDLPPEALSGSRGGGGRMVWSPDGRTIAGVGGDHSIWLWDVEQGERISHRAVLRGHTQRVTGIVFTPDSRSILSGSEDGSLRLWDVANGHCARVITGHVASLNTIDWSPDGTQLVAGGWDRRVTIYDVSGKVPPRVLHEHNDTLVGAAWSPDGRTIASVEWENAIWLWRWESKSWACLGVLRYVGDAINRFFDVAWSPDGRWLASGTSNHGVLLWDVSASLASHPVLLWDRPEQPDLIRSAYMLAWSPDGAYLAAGVGDSKVSVWDVATGSLLRALEGHQSRVTCVTWSPDGHKVVSASTRAGRGELFVWNVQSGARVHSIDTDPEASYRVCWGSVAGMESRSLVSGGRDGTLRWWNLSSGECEKVRSAHIGKIEWLKRSPDGTRFASCGDDGAVMIWDLQTGDLLQTLRWDRPYERLDISGINGLTEAQKTALRALGAVEQPVPVRIVSAIGPSN